MNKQDFYSLSRSLCMTWIPVSTYFYVYDRYLREKSRNYGKEMSKTEIQSFQIYSQVLYEIYSLACNRVRTE